jgi:hypothetical protein
MTVRRNCGEIALFGLRLKWSLQHLIGLGVLFDGVSRSGQQTGAGIGA